MQLASRLPAERRVRYSCIVRLIPAHLEGRRALQLVSISLRRFRHSHTFDLSQMNELEHMLSGREYQMG